MIAKDICNCAASLVGGEGAQRHGNAQSVHGHVAELRSAYLDHPITGHDVTTTTVPLKMRRTEQGAFNIDDYADATGYAGIVAEVAHNG